MQRWQTIRRQHHTDVGKRQREYGVLELDQVQERAYLVH
jgi:hypothetical protein